MELVIGQDQVAKVGQAFEMVILVGERANAISILNIRCMALQILGLFISPIILLIIDCVLL